MHLKERDHMESIGIGGNNIKTNLKAVKSEDVNRLCGGPG
jgi:hypothetical protein